ncbi:hypothetical protein COCNU_02G009170 [Cocos nucifera]|uniref:Acyl-[acyl-carrier-protein] hydrolase n=1 Tax=Cocos nucifera TaxID=13894 RepID=A0A8K0MX95_COCNU|nr:hypothetical protein COCNU_02G009170 [Cocos nucifera]
MATITARSSTSLCLRRSGAGKIEGVPKVGVVVGWARKREVRGLCVKGDGDGDGDGYQVSSVDTVNGRKVNGVVHGSDASLYVGTGRGMGLGAEDGGGMMVSVVSFKLGRFVEDRFVYRQAFVIRSYEIGPDETATMETLMNLLQNVNFTVAMSVKDVGKMAYDRGDVVEIDTWVAASGKNGMRRDWIIRDYNTKKIIARATSKWVMMNRETRMLSKIPEQVKQEVKPFYLDRKIIHESSDDKIDKLTDETAENIRSGLAVSAVISLHNQYNESILQNVNFTVAMSVKDVGKMAYDRGDVVEIDTWVAASGKNGMRRDWIIRDYNTKKIIARATSKWVMMNRETRMLSKIPEQVKQEVKPFYLDRKIIHESSDDKIDKLTDETAENIRSGLAVSAVISLHNQYNESILQSVPMNVLEDYHLTSITLQYRRECRQSQLLESLTSMTTSDTKENASRISSCKPDLGSTHLLRLQEDKAEVIRASAEWQRKQQA